MKRKIIILTMVAVLVFGSIVTVSAASNLSFKSFWCNNYGSFTAQVKASSKKETCSFTVVDCVTKKSKTVKKTVYKGKTANLVNTLRNCNRHNCRLTLKDSKGRVIWSRIRTAGSKG